MRNDAGPERRRSTRRLRRSCTPLSNKGSRLCLEVRIVRTDQRYGLADVLWLSLTIQLLQGQDFVNSSAHKALLGSDRVASLVYSAATRVGGRFAISRRNLIRGPAPLPVGRERALARDDEFAAFVAARYRAFVRTGLLLTGDTGHAEDLTQSALIGTYLAWGRLREPANAEAYARRTLVRLALRARQRRWTAEVATAQIPESGAGPLAGIDDLALDVRRALAALPAAQRAVLVLRYLADQSEAETPRLLGIAPGTGKSRAAPA